MCIFCDIVNKKIPAYTLYEDEQVIAFLDISQVTKGHTLVIPKHHYENILECPSEELAHLMDVAKQLGKHILTQTQANGMHVLSNVKEAAGQTVMHFHVHLIPRYDESDACIIAFQESEKQNLEELTKLLALTK